MDPVTAVQTGIDVVKGLKSLFGGGGGNLSSMPIPGGPTVGVVRAAVDNARGSNAPAWAAFSGMYRGAVGSNPPTSAGGITELIRNAMTHGDALQTSFLSLVGSYGTYCTGHDYCGASGLPASAGAATGWTQMPPGWGSKPPQPQNTQGGTSQTVFSLNDVPLWAWVAMLASFAFFLWRHK